jgi:fructan beta-fructosidase
MAVMMAASSAPVTTVMAADNTNIESILQEVNSSIKTAAAETGITNFKEVGDAGMTIDEDAGTITLKNSNGDHIAMYSGQEKKTKAFTWEADVTFNKDASSSEGLSAGLIFGASNKNNAGTWCAANVDTRRSSNEDLFRVFGPSLDTNHDGSKRDIDLDQPLHLKLEMEENGEFTYSFGNVGGSVYTIKDKYSSWDGGFVGLLSFCSEATFSNVAFEDKTQAQSTENTAIELTESYKTNLGSLAAIGSGEWKSTEDGLYSNAVDKGDCFAVSETEGSNFVYSTDVTFKKNQGAASLIFRSNNDMDNKEAYAVNLDASSHKCKFWRWQSDSALQLIDEKEIEATDDNTYTLKVVACDEWISYYVNDVLVASSGDYTLQKDDKGQNTVIEKGYFGLLNWNGEMTFQNTYYQELADDAAPILKNISVSSSTGTVEKAVQFTATEPITIQYVKNDAKTVNIDVETANDQQTVEITDADGKVYTDGKDIPVAEGKNYITVKSSVKTENNGLATVTYRVNVHRLAADETYYNEVYRDQYHYSVKEGWANDPNGLVYYKGTYHMFYQFYDDTQWGPMHWAHATSTDLIHWEEQPIALYPDANGAMFSGCIVADENNTSGLFEDGEGGLVALITADGNGQRIKVAYSSDEGQTWTKSNKVAADYTDDPLGNSDFRDPKVFRYENKWFMVVAGGPLRIYSSDNLTEWECESTYSNLHTECPDLYPIQTEDGTVKWVLSRGGRYYKVGDFKEVNGKWKFVPDSEYENTDGVMNFGKDSYAAMTYYVQDFGTAENPTIPDIIELNWMNTWDDYCNKVADTVDQNFNGTFNLNLKLGLTKEDGSYVLTQTPIEAYESLRDTDNEVVYKDVDVTEGNNLLDEFSGDTYEIVSTFYPSEGTTKVGFRLRSSADGKEYTDVIYDLKEETLSIDRSKSGIIISNEFAKVNSQKVTKNEDGSIDLHIYVDKASVEVFTKGNTVTGANQIFPTATSLGASVIAEGATAKANIAIYPMNSIWTDKAEITTAQEVKSLQSETQNLYVGDSVSLGAYVYPVSVDQSLEWEISSGSDVVSMEVKNNTATVTALKAGEATITAKSKADPTKTKTFTIKVRTNNFKTNIKELINQAGNWIIDDEVLSDANTSSNDFYMSADKVSGKTSTMETDLAFEKGVVNLFYASNATDPNGAYTVQFDNSSNKVRLFRMYGDTIAEGPMPAAINDGTYHHVKIEKGEKSVVVYVDGEKYLDYTFDTVDDFYNDAYVGVGLWDGAVNFKNLYVDYKETPAEKAASTITLADKTATYTGKAISIGKANVTGSTGKVTYTYYSDAKCTKKLSGAPVNAGTYYVKATVAADDNYKAATSKAVKLTINKAASTITLAAKTATYTGKAISIGKASVKGSTGKVTYTYYSDAKCTKKVSAHTNAGTYYVKASVAADTNYKAATSKAVKLTVKKASQKITVKKASASYKVSDLKKAKKTFSIGAKANGKLTYKVTSGSKYISVAKDGKVTVKKNAKKGTYKVSVSAASTGNYNAATKTITITVK